MLGYKKCVNIFYNILLIKKYNWNDRILQETKFIKFKWKQSLNYNRVMTTINLIFNINFEKFN